MTALLLPNGTASHFTEAEAADPLTSKIIMAPGHLEAVEELRLNYKRPLIVTSWCRSDAYIKELINRGYNASLNSFHLMKNKNYGTKTCAVDVARPNGQDLYDLIMYAQAANWSVGLAKTFIHLDQRSTYTQLPQTFYTY